MDLANKDSPALSQAQTSRRRFLARNVLAIGAILATSAVAKAGGNNNDQGGTATTTTKAAGAQCFLKGTKIRTAEGERKVENLAVGDLLPTLFGGMRPIQWVARYPTRRAIPLSHGHGTPARFASPVRPLRPVFLTLISS